MTVGVPSGQQDLGNFQIWSLLLTLRRNEVSPCLSDLQRGNLIGQDVGFISHAAPAECTRKAKNNASV